MNPTAGLDAEAKTEIFTYRESNPSRLGPSLVNILRHCFLEERSQTKLLTTRLWLDDATRGVIQ